MVLLAYPTRRLADEFDWLIRYASARRWSYRSRGRTHATSCSCQQGSLVEPDDSASTSPTSRPHHGAAHRHRAGRQRPRALDAPAVRVEAEAARAIALFGEQHGEQVCVVDIGDFSRELHGVTTGTAVQQDAILTQEETSAR